MEIWNIIKQLYLNLITLNVYSNKSSSIINIIDTERYVKLISKLNFIKIYKYKKYIWTTYFNLIFRTKQIETNQKRLIPIIECIMLCGQQEVALSGHRDYDPICFSSMYNI